ncbi:MAG: ComF family protein [Oscillospiraceae bacterium]|nr:ComF family protein [Oscillospiraceae bacterium]
MNLIDLLFPPKCVFCRTRSRQSICGACQGTLPWVTSSYADGVASPLYYSGKARDAVLRYKFNGFSLYAKTFGLLMAQAAQNAGLKPDLITWVPSSRLRRWKRGYDQCERLSAELSRVMGIPRRKLLKKTTHTKSQTKMRQDKQRTDNVRGAYTVCSPCDAKTVLLIDDVYTTGSTIYECREALLRAGVPRVLCLTLARSRR